MKQTPIKRIVPIAVFIFFSFFMFACTDNDDEPEPNTYSSLWNNSFQYCGIGCHNQTTASDGTENGPDLSSKSNFYNNLVNKSASDYPTWQKGSNCTVDFITPGNANRSSMAAALILSVSDTLTGDLGCVTSYNQHEVLGQTISDNALKNELITWINDGAQNN